MAKLTLSVNPKTIAQAKRYARQHGVSLSSIVEAYLSSVSSPLPDQELPPILRSLRGILKRGSREDYRKYLTEKYL